MARKKDIFSLLKADHRKVKALFKRIEHTTERAQATRSKLYSTLRNELEIHTTAEESALYPVLKQREKTQDMGFEGVVEHSLVKYLLGQMDETSCDTEEWTAQAKALKELIEHHIEEEESEMFKQMRAEFNREELLALGADFQEAKQYRKSLETSKAA